MTEQIITSEVLACAAATLACRNHGLPAALDVSDAPTYVTDADGYVVYANDACEPFAGRAPVLGEDRWCVAWRLYTGAGEPLPHDQGHLAMAISEQRPILGASAVAERPDGTRVQFKPFPTPIFGRGGRLVGAVNVLAVLSA